MIGSLFAGWPDLGRFPTSVTNGVPLREWLVDAVGNPGALMTPRKQNRPSFNVSTKMANWNPSYHSNTWAGRCECTRGVGNTTDLTHYYRGIVMHMNPDGTEE